MEMSEEQVNRMAAKLFENSSSHPHPDHWLKTSGKNRKSHYGSMARYVLSLLLPAKEALETARLWIGAGPGDEKVYEEIDAALAALKGLSPAEAGSQGAGIG